MGVLGEPDPRFLDPHQAYTAEEWALLRCCLARTLVSYNGRSYGEGGLELRPDLATALPEVSPDRMSWTFDIRTGLRYAPPLDDVEITASDFVRALERVATHPWAQKFGYGFYYSIIDGFDEYGRGDADSIAGLETPDDHTLVVHLREPSTNLAGLFALHATSPLPADPDDATAQHGVAAGHVKDYGSYLVSSGPYMFERDPPIDFFENTFSLVRNPSWDADEDDLHPAFPDRIDVTIRAGQRRLIADVNEGRLDVLLNVDHPSRMVARYAADPKKSDRVIEYPSRAVWYAVMNLAMPPFDDVHVRKAINHVVDRRRLAQLVTRAGDIPAVPHGHIVSDSLQDNLLLDYHPYGAPGGSSDVARARAEMAHSRYDIDNDGLCDRPACRGIAAPATFPLGPGLDAFEADLKRIGIEIRPRLLSLDRFYDPLWPERHVPLAIGNGWVDDANTASTVFKPLFASENAGRFTTALVGATPKQLQRWGYSDTHVPDVDARLDICSAQVGHRQLRCWAELDAYLMEKVAAFVPLMGGRNQRILSERVIEASFDAETTYPALDSVAVSGRGR